MFEKLHSTVQIHIIYTLIKAVIKLFLLKVYLILIWLLALSADRSHCLAQNI